MNKRKLKKRNQHKWKKQFIRKSFDKSHKNNKKHSRFLM